MFKNSHYVWQPFLLVLFIVGALLLFRWRISSNILWAVGAGSLSSSAYIVFGKPSKATAQPLHIFISYVIAMCAGIFFRYIIELHLLSHFSFFDGYRFYFDSVVAALAVAVTLGVTAKMHLDHPPAAGVALILVLDIKDYQTLIILLFSVIMLSLLSLALRRWMRDLF